MWQSSSIWKQQQQIKTAFTKKFKRRFNLGNTCYHSLQNLLSSCLLSKNKKIKIYKTRNFTPCFYGYETWFLTLREEHSLRFFENRVLRRIFGPKSEEGQEDGEDCIMRRFITCKLHQILIGLLNREG
jgi:hypothetical protein